MAEINLNSTPPLKDLLPKDIEPQPICPEGMRKFTIFRRGDESNVSGTGKIIQGVLFADGKAVIQWLAGPDPGDTQVKNSFEKFLETHIIPHPGNRTILTWEDGIQIFFPEEDNEATGSTTS